MADPATPAEDAPGGTGRDGRMALVLGCFFLSGASALVYQTAWTREFAFTFGASELAVATVLAAYMGGLAGGAALGGWLAPRVRRPVLAYGALELAVGLSALAVPSALRLATALYVRVFGGASETPDVGGLATALFYAACAFAILAVPTLCMGATLPLLARHAVRDDRDLGRRIGALYAVNALGAVAGTLLAGFVLVPRFGLGPTVACAVAANLAIFLLALPLARSAAPSPAAPAFAARRGRPGLQAVLPLMLVSGVASFSYEVLWTRLLGQLLGASVYAFATMLASFLAGIALGAAFASRFATDARRSAAGLALAQATIALCALGALPVLEAAAALAGRLGLGAGAGPGLGAAIAGATLLPSTLAIGATFPFAVRIAARGAEDAGPASARVYAWNTVGAIAGALGAGFFAIPALGFASALAAAALANAGLALASAWLVAPRLARAPWLALPLAVGIAALWPETPWTVLRTTPLTLRRLEGELRYFAVGRSTTVLLLERGGAWYLTNNGLPEAAIVPRGGVPSRDPTLRWLALLPTLARPDAREIAVVGFGGGALLELLAPSVRAVDVVELEPEVIAANAAIGPERRADPLADPRIRVILNDARNALALSGKRYDAIVSQPSHPWTAGASHLYTREFFALAASRLREDGVLVQWIGPAYVDEALLRTLVATLADVLPHVRVYQARRGAGILLVASREAIALEAGFDAARAAAPAALAAAGLHRREDVIASLGLDEAGARRFAAGAPLNTDRRNYLQIRSPRLRATRGRTLLALEDVTLRPGLAPALPEGVERPALVRSLLARGFRRRALALASASPDAEERRLIRALVAEHAGESAAALAGYRQVLAARPHAVEAKAGLVRLLGAEATREGLALDPAERTVLTGMELERSARGGESTLADLDAELAAVPGGHPLALEATRLRVAWRLAAATPARGREAIALLDERAAVATPARLAERARAGAAAQDPEVLLGSAEALLGVPRVEPAVARHVLRLLQSTAAPPALAARFDEAERRLAALASAGSADAPASPE